MFYAIYKNAIEDIQNLDSEYRLIIIHPNYNQQHLVLHELVNDGAAYVRFHGRHALSSAEMQNQLQQALASQLDRDTVSAGDVLVLDECDRADSAELSLFLAEVLDAVGPGRVFALTRTSPNIVLNNDAIRQKTCFIPANDGLMLWDYAQRSREKQVLLEVRAFGSGRVMLNGEPINDWDGVLPRALFFFLVDKGMTTRNDIFDTFWPTLSVREATNVFHVTKRKISEVLGVDLTSYWSGFYHISPTIELSYDVVQFSERVQESVIAPVERATDLLQGATWLYHDDFLTSMNSDWVTKRRDELRQTYGDALIARAKMAERQGDKLEALGLYLRASKTNPQREDIARSAMLIYRDMGMLADALEVYQRLELELHTKIGVAPARDLQELAKEIQRM